ncbi:hypothetical protein H5410_057486, partial [Solanum commersonii]
TESMDFSNTFCGEHSSSFFEMLNSDACLNHIFLLSVDFLLLLILVCKISLRKSSSRAKSNGFSFTSGIFNGCLGLGYIAFGAWKLKEKHQEYRTVLLLVHGITWLFVSSFISLCKQQTFRTVKIYSIVAFLLAMFLCITSLWKFRYDDGNVIESIEVILNSLSFLGAILLIYSGFKESEYDGTRGVDLCDEIFYKPIQEFEDEINSYEITPFANAGSLGKLSFVWLNPLMKKGKEKILEDVDVPHLRSADGSRTCFDLFNEQVEMLKRKDPLGRPSILMAILLFHHKSILISGVFALIKILTLTTGPLFLHTFIEVAEGRESFKYEGYALTAGFFLVKCLESLAERQWHFRSRLIGLQIWTTILQLILVSCVMFYSIGVASSAALVIVILTVLVNSPLAKLQLKYQTNLMILQDKRLKAITEALVHIKVLKLYSWEKHFMDAINKLRLEETKWLSSVLTQKGYYFVLFWSSPILVSSATFVACYLFQVPLNVSNVFTFLASFRLVQDPIRRLPDVVEAFIEANVSLSRIVKFLEEQ